MPVPQAVRAPGFLVRFDMLDDGRQRDWGGSEASRPALAALEGPDIPLQEITEIVVVGRVGRFSDATDALIAAIASIARRRCGAK